MTDERLEATNESVEESDVVREAPKDSVEESNVVREAPSPPIEATGGTLEERDVS